MTSEKQEDNMMEVIKFITPEGVFQAEVYLGGHISTFQELIEAVERKLGHDIPDGVYRWDDKEQAYIFVR